MTRPEWYKGDWNRHKYEMTIMWLIACEKGWAKIAFVDMEGDLVFEPIDSAKPEGVKYLVYDHAQAMEYINRHPEQAIYWTKFQGGMTE